jgi:hypothetical protein
MKKALLLQLLIVLVFSCQNDDSEQLEIMDQGPHLVKVMTRSDCESNILLEEQDVLIEIYAIESQFDFSEKTLIETLSPNAEGSYSTNLEFGHFYCEVTRPDGAEVLTGIVRLPEDFEEDGTLNLVKGRKRGFVYERLEDDSIGEKISNATIKHRNEITGAEQITQSNEFGRVCIELNPGRYYIEVTHEAYQTYTSEQGFNVFYMGMNGTNNFFLKP